MEGQALTGRTDINIVIGVFTHAGPQSDIAGDEAGHSKPTNIGQSGRLRNSTVPTATQIDYHRHKFEGLWEMPVNK